MHKRYIHNKGLYYYHNFYEIHNVDCAKSLSKLKMQRSFLPFSRFLNNNMIKIFICDETILKIILIRWIANRYIYIYIIMIKL